MATCIVDIPTGRRFLAENEAKIEHGHTDFTPLFPHGFLRQMTGENHLHYRRLFIDSFRSVQLESQKDSICDIIDKMMMTLRLHSQPVKIYDVRNILKDALTSILFLLVLGVDRNWRQFDKLTSFYKEYAPDGTDAVVRSDKVKSYEKIKRLVLERAEELKTEKSAPSLLQHFVSQGNLDETVLGNLLQMVEAGRYDMMGLWTWIFRITGDNQDVIDQIHSQNDLYNRSRLAQAVVLETLRLEQIEFILRKTTDNIVFDGFFIPKGTIVKICIWEAHKDPEKFEQPFKFDPMRFVSGKIERDSHAPFGLGKHQCLGADWVTSISGFLVDRAATSYRWGVVGDSVASRGRFHFEPSSSQSIQFSAREKESLLA